METKIIENLSQKLSDLETRIHAYRLELLEDFREYYNDAVRASNLTATSHIQQAITSTFHKYPTLRPELRTADTLVCASPISTTTSHPAPATNLCGPVNLESPRVRDLELQGLFMPSFLPLLDGLADLPGANPTPGASTPHIDSETGQTNPARETSNSMDDSFGQGVDELLPANQQDGDLTASQRCADDSSVSSDKSDYKVRRSAMRRSSSVSKTPQSPRRVRFEVMGTEVLPTTSPQPTPYMVARPTSPALTGETLPSDSILDDELGEQLSPRKISSSDALRALSRTPLEEGTIWTIVNSQAPQSTPPDRIISNPPEAKILHNSGGLERGAALQSLNKDLEPPSVRVSGAIDDEGSSDDDFLDMAKKKTTANPILPLPNEKAASLEYSTTEPIQQAQPAGNLRAIKKEENVQDDMFHFESDPGTDTPRPLSPTITEDEEVVLDTEASSPDGAADLMKASSAVSNSVPVRKKKGYPAPTSPTTSKFRVGSIGSYKGRPVVMPVVKNPDVHARAASLGTFTSFVGGLDGGSGMDEGDLSSYRASVKLGPFTGTPRSFTERLLMEDLEAEKQRNMEDDKQLG